MTTQQYSILRRRGTEFWSVDGEWRTRSLTHSGVYAMTFSSEHEADIYIEDNLGDEAYSVKGSAETLIAEDEDCSNVA